MKTYDRHVAQLLGDALEIGPDLLLGLQARHRRDHDARGAEIHRAAREIAELLEAGIGDANDDLRAAVGALHDPFDEGGRFLRGQLRRLAHDAEDRHAVDAAFEIEIDEAVGRRPVHRPRVCERCRGDDVDAARGLVEKGHGSLAQNGRCPI
jgi:hypothetical protein